MPPIRVSVINQSKTLENEMISASIPALQKQVSDHLAPVWRVDASLKFVSAAEKPDPEAWRLLILDTTDVPDDSGYHYVDDDGPIGKVFAATAKGFGQNWTIVASHELLEMLVNPYGNLAAFVADDSSGKTGIYYDLEICDPVFPDPLGYEVGGVMVSNFVFPEWFSPLVAQPDVSKPSRQVDFARRLDGPTKLGSGAMAAICSVGRQNWWSDAQVTDGKLVATAKRAQRQPSTLKRTAGGTFLLEQR